MKALWRKIHSRLAVTLIAAGLVNFIMVFVAIKTTKLNAGQMAIWPGDGVILAFMLGVLRRHPISALIIGMCGVVGAEISLGNSIVLAAPLAAINTLSIYGVFFVVTRVLGERDVTQSKAFVKFICVAACGAAVTGVSLGVTVTFAYHLAFFPTFASSTIGNIVGCAVFTPIILLLTTPRDTEGQLKKPLWVHAVSLAAYSLLVLVVFFQNRYPMLFLVPLGLMAVAYTTSLATLAFCVLLTVTFALGSTLAGLGPFDVLAGGVQVQRYTLQAFLAIITATTLPIAALMAEHAKLKVSLINSRLEAELANQAKSTFLATISHEIRTPLNGILGMAQIVAMDELSPSQKQRIAVIRGSGETLLTILNDVLDLSKIEAGKLTLEEIDFSVGELLTSTVGIYESLTRTKGIDLRLEISGDEGHYRGDPTRLRQILSNLISNAIKFTAAGAVTVRASLEDDRIMLAVSDTGIGIPAEKVATLFDKFTQVDASTTRKFGGTGLGLSICRELAELMNGTLTVQSVEGEGSTFTASLPLARVAASAEAEAADAGPTMLAPDLRVLAAEDNPTNQLILKTLLQFAGVDVTTVNNGQEAVDAWAEREWDVILMDVQMPVMDGVTAASIIRERERQQGRARTPIVALTANAMAHQTDEYLEKGMDDHVAKPIHAEDLLRAVFAASQKSAGRAEDGGPAEAAGAAALA